MNRYYIRKGKDLKILGVARPECVVLPLPKTIAIYPLEFKGLKPRVVVKPDEAVKVGDLLIEDKNGTGICVTSPVSGKVIAVNRGERRVLVNVVIQTDGKQEQVSLKTVSETSSREECVNALLKSGLWPALRQRPFSKISVPTEVPKSIFIKALHTDPLSLDLGSVLDGQEVVLQAGLDLVRKLTDGDVHLCYGSEAESSVLKEAQNVKHQIFSGPHPAGNVSTFLHNVDPINKGEIIWYMDVQDVLRYGVFALEGRYSADRVVAVTGEGVSKGHRQYVRTIIGAPIQECVQGEVLQKDHRYLSGSLLSGFDAGYNGFVRFYDSQIHVLPDFPQRKLLRFFRPGFNEYTFSHTYAGTFLGKNRQETSLDTSVNGSNRAIVVNDVFDKYVPLDIYTFFLLKAIMVREWDEAEKLGLLECDPEDFALAAFACPSKTDVMGLIAQGLDSIEREG